MLVDLILLCVLVAGVFAGTARGLVVALWSWGTYIVSFLLAIRFALPVGHFLDGLIGFSRFVRSYLLSRMPSSLAYAHVSSTTLKEALQFVAIPPLLRDAVIHGLHGSGTVLDLLATPIITMIQQIVGFIITLYVAQIILRIILRPVVSGLRLMVPRVLDLLGGAAFGALNVLLEIWGLVLVLPYLIHIPGFPPHIASMLQQSMVLAFVSKTFAPFVHYAYNQLHLMPASWPPGGILPI